MSKDTNASNSAAIPGRNDFYHHSDAAPTTSSQQQKQQLSQPCIAGSLTIPSPPILMSRSADIPAQASSLSSPAGATHNLQQQLSTSRNIVISNQFQHQPPPLHQHPTHFERSYAAATNVQQTSREPSQKNAVEKPTDQFGKQQIDTKFAALNQKHSNDAANVMVKGQRPPTTAHHLIPPSIARICLNWPDIFAPTEQDAKRSLPHDPLAIQTKSTSTHLCFEDKNKISETVSKKVMTNILPQSPGPSPSGVTSTPINTGATCTVNTDSPRETPSSKEQAVTVGGTMDTTSNVDRSVDQEFESPNSNGLEKADACSNVNTKEGKINGAPPLHNNGKGSKYWISRIIGHGASATVLQVKRTVDEKPFAVKVVDLGSMGQSDRFRALAEAECLIHCGNFFSILTCHEDFVVINNKNLNPSPEQVSDGTEECFDNFYFGITVTKKLNTTGSPTAAVGSTNTNPAFSTSAAAASSSIRDQPHKNDLLALVVDYANAGDLRQEIKKRSRDIQMRPPPNAPRYRKSDPSKKDALSKSSEIPSLQLLPRYFKEHEAGLLFVQILLALHHVHRKHMLHRDIKSANIFLSTNGLAKLGDFGFSKLYHNSTVSDNVGRTFCGTPYYVAPEIWRRQVYSKKADVFSLGIVLYELLTLSRPFDGKDTAEVMANTLNGQYKPLPDTITAEMKSLVAALLTDNPARRPSTREILSLPIVKFFIDGFLAIVQTQTQFSPSLRDHICSSILSVREELAVTKQIRLQMRTEMRQRALMELTSSTIGGSGTSGVTGGNANDFDGERGIGGASTTSALSFGASTSMFGGGHSTHTNNITHNVLNISAHGPTTPLFKDKASPTTTTQEVLRGQVLDDSRIWWEGNIRKVESDGSSKRRYLCIYVHQQAENSAQPVNQSNSQDASCRLPLAHQLHPDNCSLIFAVSKETISQQCICTPFSELEDAFPVPVKYTVGSSLENVFSIAFKNGKKRLLMMGKDAADREGWMQAIREVLGAEGDLADGGDWWINATSDTK